MNIEPQSFAETFKGRLFRIPDYQRGYSWGELQLRDFWDDLVNLPEGRDHYTGMLSIQRVPKSIASTWSEEAWLFNDDTDPFYVVDGQQRLTTFSILVQCFCEHFRQAHGKTRDDEILLFSDTVRLSRVVSDYVKVTKPNSFLTAYRFGYEIDNPSFKYFRHYIFDEPNPGRLEETLYTHNLKNAKTFFKDNIENFAATYGEEALEDVFHKLLHNMKLIIHEIGDDFDVFAAFETMNNRGKKLSNLELLKSRLIYLTSLLSLDADEERALRNEINDCWKEVYGQLGRNDRALPDDDFLQDHWLIRYQYSGKRGQDYASFLLGKEFTIKNIANLRSAVDAPLDDVGPDPALHGCDDPTADYEADADDEEIADRTSGGGCLTGEYIRDYTLSMKTAARWWFATFYPDDEPELTAEERKWLKRLGRLGFIYFRPLVVASFVSTGACSRERGLLFKEIERFIFVAFRMTGAYSSFNRNNTFAMARKVACGELSVSDAAEMIRGRLENWYAPATEYDQSGFENKLKSLFNSGDKKGFYTWGGLRYLLYEYEDHLVEELGNAQKAVDYFTKSPKDKVSVEHILPQAPTDAYWRERFGGYSEGEVRALTGSLGNLMLLSMSINTKLQNVSYPEKKMDRYDEAGELIRRGYSTGSHSENKVANDYEDWDAQAILRRGMQLLAFVEERWDVKFKDEEAMRKLLFIDFVE